MYKVIKIFLREIRKIFYGKRYYGYKKRDISVNPFSNIGKNVYIGNHTNINHPSIIEGDKDGCYIGKWCAIGDLLVIPYNHNVKYANMQEKLQRRYRFISLNTLSKGPIHIGNAVWIGYRVTILSGVKVGNGAVIGTGSVVTKSIPPFAIAAGVPARIIKYRFNKRIINKLEAIKWWDWDEEKIKRNKLFFNTDLTKINPNYIDKIIK